MTLVDLGVLGGCDARTQGASIAWLLARPRTRQRACTARPGDPDFILVRALRLAGSRTNGKEERRIEIAGFFERLEHEAAVQERVQEPGQRQVVDPDPRPDPGRREVPRLGLPAGSAVLGVQQRGPCLSSFDRRRPKTGMDSEIDERPSRPKHATRLGEDDARIIEVGVRQD